MILQAEIQRKSTLTSSVVRKSLLSSNIVRKSLLQAEIDMPEMVVDIPVLVPPIIIENSVPTKIKIPYDIALDEASIPAVGSYVLGSGRTVTLVEPLGLFVYLTVSSRYYWGDTETVAYTAPLTNMIKSTLGGEAVSFTATAITNNVALDSDASTFITTASITDATQKQALDQLVQGLKADSIWTPMKAIYPMVGGTATSHKWNLKDPRDLDVAFRLNFANSWTHAVTGAKPDGITAYADTFLVPNSELTLATNHISFYSRTDSQQGYDIGATNSTGLIGTTDTLALITRYTNGNAYFIADDNPFGCVVANANGQGFYSGGVADTNIQRLYKAGNEIKNDATAGLLLSTRKLSISAINCSNGYFYFSNKECAFASIGTGLTPTQHANLYTRVQAFQTKLGRNV